MAALIACGGMPRVPFQSGDLLASLLLLPSHVKLNGVSWTLVFEILFYLLFAVILPFRSLRISLAGMSAAIVVIVALGRLLPDGSWRAVLANPVALDFCFGMWLGLAVHLLVERPMLAVLRRIV